MMQDFLCDIYSSIRDKNAFLKRIRYYSLLRVFTRLTSNVILPLYFKSTGCDKRYALSKVKGRKTPIIVSLTSFPARINRVWLVIECMLRQTQKPDKIILWLSKEQFSGITTLPPNLTRLLSRGLEIQLVDGDVRSHKKYIYAMHQYPDAIIITVDDDIFYHSHTLQYLIDAHKAYPKDVITNIARQLQYNQSGELLPYREWQSALTTDNKNHIFQVGIGGVLYSPHCAHPDVCNSLLAYKLCPYGDDIWLFAMCKIYGTIIRKSASVFVPLPIYNTHNQSLSSSNLQGRNDTQIHQLMEYCIKHYGTNPFV